MTSSSEAPRWASQATPALAEFLSPLASGQGRAGLPSPRLSTKPLVSASMERPRPLRGVRIPTGVYQMGAKQTELTAVQTDRPDLGFHRLSPESALR